MLQVVHRVITRFLLKQAGVKADEAESGAVTLIQRFGSAASLNIHPHCLLLDGVYRRGTDGEPEFVEVPASTDEALHAVLHKIITRTLKSQSSDPQCAGLVHAAFCIGNDIVALRAFHAHLRELGVALHHARDHEVSQSLYLRDPDGLMVEVYVDG